jgi:signal transduction histidine kinase
MIIADAHRIQQILTNLVSNAIKYASEGAISVASELVLEKESERAPWQLRLTVEDAGPGIAPESLPHLFEPFTQLDNGAARRLDGAGLGLAIVQRLVGLLGGTVTVESELGQGTRFCVLLPVDLLTAAHGAREGAPQG